MQHDEPFVFKKAMASVKAHEGLALHPYHDTTGHLTIGYGRNLDEIGITQREAEAMLETDLTVAYQDAKSLAGDAWAELSSNRKVVLMDMAFNLGKSRLKRFVKMWEALDNKNYDRAAKEMLDSLWATQVGQRALTLADLMREG